MKEDSVTSQISYAFTLISVDFFKLFISSAALRLIKNGFVQLKDETKVVVANRPSRLTFLHAVCAVDLSGKVLVIELQPPTGLLLAHET